jgi:hypothetical protein
MIYKNVVLDLKLDLSGSRLSKYYEYNLHYIQLWLLHPVCSLQFTKHPFGNLLVQVAVTLWAKSRTTHDLILLSHLTLFGSLSVASYDSQGYGAGILTRLRTGDVIKVEVDFATEVSRPVLLGVWALLWGPLPDLNFSLI